MTSVKDYVAINKEMFKGIIEAHETKPHLLVLAFNGDKSSESYFKGLKKDCDEVGIECTYHNVKQAERLSTEQAVNIIDILQELNDFDAILVQKPIPQNIDIEELKKMIMLTQDVDGFTDDSLYEPCTPKGVVNYLEYNEYEFEGIKACVVGRSDTIGKPLSQMLLDRNCTVTICHSKTQDDHMHGFMCASDIVFTCTNKIEQFDDEYFNSNHCQDVIDFGIGIGEDGKLHGNIHNKTVSMLKDNNYDNRIVISGIGGTGLLTRVALMENILKAAYGWGTGDLDENE